MLADAGTGDTTVESVVTSVMSSKSMWFKSVGENLREVLLMVGGEGVATLVRLLVGGEGAKGGGRSGTRRGGFEIGFLQHWGKGRRGGVRTWVG